MLRGLAFLVFGLATLMSTPSSAQTWTEYKPPNAGYSIDMPGEWNSSVEKIPTALGELPAYLASMELNNRAFMTMYIQFPEDKIKAQPVTKLLDGARDGAVSNVKGTLRTEKRIVIGATPAREIVVDAPNSFVLIMRFFLINSTLVEALVAGPVGVDTEPDTDRFLSSLKIVGP